MSMWRQFWASRWQRFWIRRIRDLRREARKRGYAEAIYTPRRPVVFINLDEEPRKK